MNESEDALDFFDQFHYCLKPWFTGITMKRVKESTRSGRKNLRSVESLSKKLIVTQWDSEQMTKPQRVEKTERQFSIFQIRASSRRVSLVDLSKI